MKAHQYALAAVVLAIAVTPANALQQKYVDPSGKVQVALAKQPLSPNGASRGPATMAEGGIAF